MTEDKKQFHLFVLSAAASTKPIDDNKFPHKSTLISVAFFFSLDIHIEFYGCRSCNKNVRWWKIFNQKLNTLFLFGSIKSTNRAKISATSNWNGGKCKLKVKNNAFFWNERKYYLDNNWWHFCVGSLVSCDDQICVLRDFFLRIVAYSRYRQYLSGVDTFNTLFAHSFKIPVCGTEMQRRR